MSPIATSVKSPFVVAGLGGWARKSSGLFDGRGGPSWALAGAIATSAAASAGNMSRAKRGVERITGRLLAGNGTHPPARRDRLPTDRLRPPRRAADKIGRAHV